jgi:predicted RecB family nuclease
MLIQNKHIKSFLDCPYKTHLQRINVQGQESEYCAYIRTKNESYRSHVIQQLVHKNKSSTNDQHIKIQHNMLNNQNTFIGNCFLIIDGFRLHIDVLEKISGSSTFGGFSYIPVFANYKEKPSKEDKLFLVASGILLNRWKNGIAEYGKMLFGKELKTTRVNFEELYEKTNRILSCVKSIWIEKKEPSFLLNSHCKVCEFNLHCREKAINEDHLSLLSGITQKEIIRWNNKGYFTITQLSYAFKARRRRLRTQYYKRPHHFELKALAIRDHKTYVYDTPNALNTSKAEIYFDVEGLPDSGDYYLIGLVVYSKGEFEKYSFWADSIDEELDIFHRFLLLLRKYESYTLYHYGNYEVRFLKKMFKRYHQDCRLMDYSLDHLLKNCCNLLSYFYSHIYLPTFTNGLKEIGRYLGFCWTDSEASGIQSIVWRNKWEKTRNEKIKSTLIRYNNEDCKVLIILKKFIQSLCLQASNNKDQPTQIVYCNDLQLTNCFGFQRGQVAFPEMNYISKSAYFDYQRERVFVRTDAVIKKIQSHKGKRGWSRTKNCEPNIIRKLAAKECSNCQSHDLAKLTTVSKQIIDLKFEKSAVIRWVTQLNAYQYVCRACTYKFVPEQYKKVKSRYGHNLISWTIYQNIFNKQSCRQIGLNFQELFDFNLPKTIIHEFRDYLYDYYQPTYDQLLQYILASKVLYVDETPIRLYDENGYGWVFTNNKAVVIIYKQDRKGDLLKNYLANFDGILVSDFYSAYDSINCKQQKCLIHLIRDFNDDLLKNPFDDEFKLITREFTLLLQSIVNTIDKYGLKKKYLIKHRPQTDQFINKLISTDYNSELAQKYKKRISKNKNKLFEFLNHDNVSWNNTNAEHAIKLLAIHRNNTFKWFRTTKITNYLKLNVIKLRIYMQRRTVDYGRFADIFYLV